MTIYSTDKVTVVSSMFVLVSNIFYFVQFSLSTPSSPLKKNLIIQHPDDHLLNRSIKAKVPLESYYYQGQQYLYRSIKGKRSKGTLNSMKRN